MTNFIDTLPQETQLHIFSFLDKKSLGRCNQVNQKWKNLTNDYSLIKLRYPNIITSEEELLIRIQKFCHAIPLNSTPKVRIAANFNCSFPLNSDPTFSCIPSISIKIEPKKDKNSSEFKEIKINEKWIFTAKYPSVKSQYYCSSDVCPTNWRIGDRIEKNKLKMFLPMSQDHGKTFETSMINILQNRHKNPPINQVHVDAKWYEVLIPLIASLGLLIWGIDSTCTYMIQDSFE